MLNYRDPNGQASGRDSRASNLSTLSRATNMALGEGAGTDKSDGMPVSSRGVMSMLRSSIDTGDLGGPLGDGLGHVAPRPHPQRRGGASSRLSTASSLSNHSNYTNRAHHRPLPSTSSAPRYSTREPAPYFSQYTADTLSPTTMNISGSSPLYQVPRRGDVDSQRSMSMTNTRPYPEARLSNNRSMASLRNDEYGQHSQSPYAYPPRFQRQGHRAASPAWNEVPGSSTRRLQTYNNQMQEQLPGQMRHRVPSDTSLGRSSMGGMPRRQSDPNLEQHHYQTVSRMPRRVSRGPSPAHIRRRNEVPPPMPNLNIAYYPALEDARRLGQSAKGSISSGSTNMRTDSDHPSSDLPQPPTPKDGASMDALAGPSSSQTSKVNTSHDYYDYSEPYFDQQLSRRSPARLKTKRSALPARHVSEELGYRHSPHKQQSSNMDSGVTDSTARSAIELPATPIVPPITRASVRLQLDPSTTSDFAEASHDGRDQHEHSSVAEHHGPSPSSKQPTVADGNHNSSLSQTETSLLDSSTVDFAVKYTMPAMESTESDAPNDGTATASDRISPSSPEKNTDDGVSELIGDYQHTESKEEASIVPTTEAADKPATAKRTRQEKSVQHTPKSSDEQSFKSCTDVPDSVAHKTDPEPAKVAGPASRAQIGSQHSLEESEARSFQTHESTASPDRINSMPPSRLPSSTLESDSLSSSPALPLRKSLFGRHKASFSMASRFKSNSKRDLKQNSISASGSSSTLGNAQVPPSVPVRESSASSEAQRFNAISSFLLKGVPRTTRFSRGKQVGDIEASRSKSTTDVSTSEPAQQGQSLVGSPMSTEKSDRDPKTPVQVFASDDAVRGSSASSNRMEYSASSNDLRVNRMILPPLHHHSMSTPNIGIVETSSLYSPQDLSSKGRASTSPHARPVSLEHKPRDSHSTTHLSWIGRKPFAVPSAAASEPRLPLPSVQEDTTTDLRLSMYRYNAPQRYLHDLKEDSHEDSSLNTSASNLKNSHFRFPYGGVAGMRRSVDDGMLLPGKSSMGSRGGSGIVEGQGLPSLEFSEANLLEKLKDAFGGDIRLSRSSGRTQLGVLDIDEGPLRLSVMAGDNGQVVLESLVPGTNDTVAHEMSARTTAMLELATLKRHYSPERLMAEIDGVSIPSITQLTQRVTQMLPSLSLAVRRESVETNAEGEFQEEEEIMEHAMKEIHHVHAPSQKRSSARLRPMPGASALMIVDDDVYEEITGREKGAASPSDQCVRDLEFEVEVGEAATRAKAKGKGKAITPTPPRRLSIVTELRTPPPAVLRPQSHIESDRALRTSIESALSSTRSPRSFVSTHTATDTRPWNYDKYYPWATTTAPSVDISLPAPTTQRDSPRPGPSHLRNTLSDATTSTFTSSHAPIASPADKGSGTHSSRQQQRLSIFGRASDQAHAVGERYPTSALSPPTAIFRDHLSTSCDTSDDEDFTASRKTNRLTLRKRFSSAARSNSNTHTTPRVARSKVNPAELASPAPAHESSSSTLQDHAREAQAFTSNRHTFRDAEGMRIGAYHRQKIFESIKRIWHKSGELLRSLSHRKNVDHDERR